MATARKTVMIKLSLDLCASVLIAITFFVYAFQSRTLFRVYLTQLEVFTTSEDGLNTSVYGSFDVICAMFCSQRLSNCIDVCERKTMVKVAGMLYILFSCASLLLTLHGVMNLVGLTFRLDCIPCMRWKWPHFCAPVAQALAVAIYVGMSGFASSEYEAHIGPGLVLMFLATATQAVTAVFYGRALCNGLEARLVERSDLFHLRQAELAPHFSR